MRSSKLKVIVKNHWWIGLIVLALLLFGALMSFPSLFKPTLPPRFGYHALKINGRFVSPETFFREKNSFLMRFRRNGEIARKTDEARVDLILENIINRVVIEDYLYHNSGITVSSREADDYIDRYIKTKYDSPQDFDSFLQNADCTSRADLQKSIILYLLKLRYFSKIAKQKGLTVSPAELDSLYQKHVDENCKAVTRHILITNPDPAKTRRLATEIYRRLESGDDFNATAQKYSADEATKFAGGLQLPFAKAESNSHVAQKVFNAKPGELLLPFPTKSGYEIILVDRFIRFYHPKAEFSDMTLMERFGTSDQFKTWIAGIKSKSSIEILDPAMKAYRLFRDGRFDQAGAFYEKSFRGRHHDVYLQRAIESYQMAKNWSKVVQLSQAGMHTYPENLTYNLNKAEALYRKGLATDALTLLKNVEARSQGSIYFKKLVIQTYANLGLAQEAERVKNSLSN